MLILAPVQRIVPPFSRVRGPNVTAAALLIPSVTPEPTTVRPPPVMLPPVQLIWSKAVTTPVPLSAPPLRVNIDGVTGPVPLKFAVALPEIASVLLVQM